MQPHYSPQHQLTAHNFFADHFPLHHLGSRSLQRSHNRGCSFWYVCSLVLTHRSCFSLIFFGIFFIKCILFLRYSCPFVVTVM